MYFRIRKLEQAWNRLFIRALGKMMPSAPSEKPDWGARPYRVLYLRYDRIGDMLVSTSLIEAIARSHPTITLDVLASPANAPVLERNPYVSRVIVWNKSKPATYRKLLKELRNARYDAVIDCMVLAPSTTTLVLMLATGARNRIGIGGRINDYALTIRVPPAESAVHHIEHSAVLATPFGVNVDDVDWQPTLYFSDEEVLAAERAWTAQQGQRLLVNISTGPAKKAWPTERFVQTIEHVRRVHPELEVIVIGATHDSARAEEIADKADAKYVATETLRDALALVKTADVVFTPDTGIAHAASACRTSAVILFAQGKEAVWGGYGIATRSVVSDNKLIASIPAERAIAALEDLLTELTSIAPTAT